MKITDTRDKIWRRCGCGVFSSAQINPMNQELFSLLFAAVVLIATVWLFIHFSRKLRKGGGSMTTTLLGSTYLFYDKEKKKAVKYIVERKAGKKMEEQSSEEPEEEEASPEEE